MPERGKSEDKGGQLKVAAPMVQVRLANGTVGALYEGDVVTDAVSAESVEHLKAVGLIAE